MTTLDRPSGDRERPRAGMGIRGMFALTALILVLAFAVFVVLYLIPGMVV